MMKLLTHPREADATLMQSFPSQATTTRLPLLLGNAEAQPLGRDNDEGGQDVVVGRDESIIDRDLDKQP